MVTPVEVRRAGDRWGSEGRAGARALLEGQGQWSRILKAAGSGVAGGIAGNGGGTGTWRGPSGGEGRITPLAGGGQAWGEMGCRPGWGWVGIWVRARGTRGSWGTGCLQEVGASTGAESWWRGVLQLRPRSQEAEVTGGGREARGGPPLPPAPRE